MFLVIAIAVVSLGLTIYYFSADNEVIYIKSSYIVIQKGGYIDNDDLLDFKNKSEEELTYRNFYSHGFFMFFFASLILAVVEYVYYGFINTEFITEQYNTLLQNIEIIKQTMPDASQIEEIVNSSPIPTASQMAMQNIWMYSFAGIIISLINAYILNKTK
jgi:hypothetical protein